MASIPDTRYEMRRARYQHIATRKCRACPKIVEFWKTTHGKNMVFDSVEGDDTPMVSHFTTCTDPNRFSRKNPAAAPAPGRDANAILQQLRSLQTRFRARAVVLVDDQGHVAAWRTGIPAEDLRNDLISAANFVRNEVSKGDTTL